MHAFDDTLLGPAQIAERERDILEDVQMRKQRVVLKYDSDLPLVRRNARHGAAVDHGFNAVLADLVNDSRFETGAEQHAFLVDLGIPVICPVDMRDPAAHLSRPDDADFANLKRRIAGTGLRPLFDLDHVLPPVLRRCRPELLSTIVNGRACRVPPPIPEAPGRDRRRARNRRPGRSAPLHPC